MRRVAHMIGGAPTGGHVRARRITPCSAQGDVTLLEEPDPPDRHQAFGPPPTSVFQPPLNEPVTTIRRVT